MLYIRYRLLFLLGRIRTNTQSVQFSSLSYYISMIIKNDYSKEQIDCVKHVLLSSKMQCHNLLWKIDRLKKLC